MPIYEYICRDCGSEFEELTLSAEEKPDCPACGSDSVDKKLSAFASCSIGGNFNAGSSQANCGTKGFT
ncbi:zinc ribbon domain-containing protein [bacterium]|nr:zinc ribbon domain-containing protein [bacterium]